MADLDAVAIRQVLIAGTPAFIEGRQSDSYFQNVEAIAQGFGTLAALAARHTAAGNLVLDIGANIGLSTIALARACPNERIIAFEPSPINARLLRRNLAANDIANVTVMQLAVSDREGELSFHEGPSGAGSHVVTDEHLRAAWASVRVPMMTLDEAIRQLGGGKVGFAKIDAEGHEPNILAGARHMLQRDAPVLYMEFNAWCLNAFGGHSPAAFARALWRAFTVSRTDPDGVLSAAEPGALDFLYGNLTQHGCVDDLVLQLRPDVEFPTLIEMSWPVQAREQASNRFWRVASPRRLVAAFANAIRGRDSRSLGNTLALRNAFKPIAHALRSVLGLNGVAAGISAMSLSMADTQAALHDIDARLQTLAGPAPEPEAQSASLPDMQLFSGYRPDELAILDKYHATTLRPQPGFIVDFIGTRIATDIVWTFAAERLNGAVLDVPVPGDFHAEAIEWIGVLKCVESAGNRFAVIELGAGFGTWAIASAVAARAKGIGDIRIAMVEGDPRHCASARLHFANNGFDPDAHTILHAAVGVENGIAHWPRSDAPASEDGWNHRPNFGEGDYMGRSFDDMMEVQVVAMRDLIVLEPEWNLVHIDVQGHEVDIVRSCLEEIGRRAHWIVVGTHSRKLDGDFIAMMHDAGWLLENEKPAKFTYNRGFPTLEGMTTLDGTQVWRNPRF